MKMIPNWRRWWRRHSVWIGSLMPTITWAREQMPALQEHLPPATYSVLMVVLFVAMIVAMQIHQDAVSGPKP